MKVSLVFVIVIITVSVNCHNEFTTQECLEAHNKLRKLHVNTAEVTYSSNLERDAQIFVNRLERNDETKDVRPRRVEPKRRRRHTNNINPDVHLESWDGEIYFPSRTYDLNRNRDVRIGENIHKFCCNSFPHCPKEFFHNLLFPPSAAGVVKDWYNQEIGSYDFSTGKTESEFSQINHFASIVWQNTTKIGCAQSKVTSSGCVFTVVLYEVEGGVGTPKDFIKNIGALESDSSEDRVLTIFLIIFFIVLLIALAVLCFCCRNNIKQKYLDVKIKTDTMKAEQELETDSTNFWWLRIFKKKKLQRRRTTVSRPKHMSLKERPSIEVVPNSAPQRTRPIPPRVRGSSNASSVIKYQGISKKPQSMVIHDNHGYDGRRHTPLIPKVSNTPVNQKLARVPSLSGKAPPPPVPNDSAPIYGNINVDNKAIYGNVNGSVEYAPDNSIQPVPPKRPQMPLGKVPLTAPKPQTPSPKTVVRPMSVPVNKPAPVPRKNTVPVELGGTDGYDNPQMRTPPVMKKPLLPPIKPRT